MVTYRTRPDSIELKANNIEDLKRELEGHLTRSMQRQPKDITTISTKIPMGFSCTIEAGEEFKQVFPFPIAGVIQDLMTVTPDGIKDLHVKITAVAKGVSQRVETRVQDAFRVYAVEAKVPALSYVLINIVNSGKAAASCIVGFTFKEVDQNEIKTIGLVGNLEDGSNPT